MHELVVGEGQLPRDLLSAHTAEGLLPGVHPLLQSKLRVLAEHFSVVPACIWLVLGVDTPVDGEVQWPGELFPTHRVWEEILPGVHLLQLFQGRATAEKSLAALHALTWLLPLCLIWCSMKFASWLKALPQYLHLKGFSPVCTRW